MDTIAFKVRPSDHGFGNEIEIEINGESLVSNLRAFEMPLAQAEGHPNIAGGYSGLPASFSLAAIEAFLWRTTTSRDTEREGRATTLWRLR